MYEQLIAEISQLSKKKKQAIIKIYQHFSDGLSVNQTEFPSLVSGFDYLSYEDSQIIACFGCDKRPTPHGMRWGANQAYGWCIWDAFFICQLVGKAATIQSKDPMREQAFSIAFNGEKFETKELWFTFPVTTVSQQLDLRSCFCQRVHGFVSLESADSYAASNGCEVIDYPKLLQRTLAMVNALQS